MRDDFYGKMYYAPRYTEEAVFFQNGSSCFYVWTDREVQKLRYTVRYKLKTNQKRWLKDVASFF